MPSALLDIALCKTQPEATKPSGHVERSWLHQGIQILLDFNQRHEYPIPVYFGTRIVLGNNSVSAGPIEKLNT